MDENLTWTIGDIKVTRIVEIEGRMPLANFLLDATPENLAPHREMLMPHWLSEGDISALSIHCLVIEVKDRKIVVDTCVGEQGLPAHVPFEVTIDFLQAMEDAGFPRESIDTVLCTHLHWDHVGWNTMTVDGKLVPTFPNARYLFGQMEYDHWKDRPDDEVNRFFSESVQAIVDADLVDMVSTDHQLTEGIRLVHTPGHSPGHCAVMLESGGQTAMITGDMCHHPVQWPEPEWGHVVDSDQEMAAQTRRDISPGLMEDEVLIIGTHYPAPGAGKLIKHNGHFYLKP
jgi:glyoxylase-like metal-dependent hydrolase (beta-lactamase superfamily II)